MTRRLLALVCLAAFGVLAMAGPATAHPLGNFTSNTFASLRVQPDAIAVRYVLDLAEIPTVQTLQRIDGDGQDGLSPSEADAYATQRCAELSDGLQLTADDAALPVGVTTATAALLPGEAGLQTLRLECDLVAPAADLVPGTHLRFIDGNLADRVGWREIVAVGDGAQLRSADVPDTSVSQALRVYPAQQLSSPLRTTEANLVIGNPGGAAAGAPEQGSGDDGVVRGIERLTAAFTDLVADRSLTLGYGLFAFGVALLLGAMHAVAPGHGKTVMAAYLIGREGTARDALLLGATVAVTHTTGVLLLGIVLSVSQTLAPERLYPVLGAVSGVLFALVGVTLLRQALANRRHGHAHDHAHGHHDGPGGHSHGPPTAPRSRRSVGWRTLVVPGLAGGLVPSPSALVVLLGGIAIGRAWFGVALVVAYGLGMAATLVGAGYLLLRARGSVQRRASGRWRRAEALVAVLPLVTATMIILGGAVIVARSVAVA